MNTKMKRIDKLESLVGMGKQAPCKLMIYQILEGVKTLHCEQVLHDPKQKNDIVFTLENVDLSKFPKST